jgi:predicted RNA binding protein YcfA (HicA-like mRNA interferase family)
MRLPLANLPTVTAKELLALLVSLGFELIRINGSHHRLRHPDGRVTTVPVHAGRDIPKGLLRKIIREDLKMAMDEFAALLP